MRPVIALNLAGIANASISDDSDAAIRYCLASSLAGPVVVMVIDA